MRPAPWLALAVGLSAAAQVAAARPECPVAGAKIHWIADYCMSLLETDDEIPASPCIAQELDKAFTSDCAAKLHYKRAMCARSIRLGHRRDDIDGCLADPNFVGATVRRGGVGGR
ncbi:MAG: hypothetical protein ABI409_02165 [Ramlibacter sp.]